MTTPCRSCWQNCALESDPEIADIDRMEDRLGPPDAETTKIRELISGLELCHHKAERWIDNVVEAISTGRTNKGLGTRAVNQLHPQEVVWQNACTALSAWCAGGPIESIPGQVPAIPASRLLAGLGQRSPLRQWQVQRVIDKIRSVLHWPRPLTDPGAQYVWLLLDPGAYELAYHEACPSRYREHEDFWLATVKTIIHDTEQGEPAALSLGLAIDMLWPCHWRFITNLRIVLDAIGGRLTPEEPFAACGRNIGLLASRGRMKTLSRTLGAFGDAAVGGEGIDENVLARLGPPTPVKKWLAASLDKTIRLQLDPPAELRAVSALTGPDWIRQ